MSLVERYKTFVHEQFTIVSSVETQHYGMWTLAKNEMDDPEDIGRYYLTKLSSSEGGVISVLTDKKDIYVVALAYKMYVWFLKDTVTIELLMKIFSVNEDTNLPRFVPLHFEGDYDSPCTQTVGRDSIKIGFNKLDCWITKLSDIFPKVNDDDEISYSHPCLSTMKKGFLLLTQMLSENLRVKPLYQTSFWFANPVHGKFEKFSVTKFILACENNWGQMSDCAWKRELENSFT